MSIHGSDVCLVCCHDDLHLRRGISPCGHDDVCGQCHLRLRRLHKDKKCPICKTENPTLVVDADHQPDDSGDGGILLHKSFSDYEIWGDELGEKFIFREDVGIFFPVQYYKESVLPLFSLRCGCRNCDFTNEEDTFVVAKEEDATRKTQPQEKKKEKKRLGGMKALKEHLRTAHGLTLCQLCVDAKRDFISSLPRFTPSQLKDHQARGDGNRSGFKGHPLCKFCLPKRFYDITKVSCFAIPTGNSCTKSWQFAKLDLLFLIIMRVLRFCPPFP